MIYSKPCFWPNNDLVPVYGQLEYHSHDIKLYVCQYKGSLLYRQDIYRDQCSSIPICSGLFDLKHQKSNLNSGCKESRSLNSLPFSSVQLLSCVQLFVTPWTAARQASLSITNSWSLFKFMSTESVMSSNHLILYQPLLLTPSIFPRIRSLFKWFSSLHQVAKVLEFQLQHQSFQWIIRTDFLEDGLVRSLCSPRDSQESTPIPQFKSINSLVLRFLYSPTLTSIHDYWKNHSLD